MISRLFLLALVLAPLAVDRSAPSADTSNDAAEWSVPLPPAEPFPPSVYRARRDRLATALGGGIAVLYARGEEDRDGYLQDSDFYYLTGIEEEGAVLVLSPEERTYKEWLFLTPRDQDAERWTGERADIGDSLRRVTGFARILRTTALEGRMVALARNAKTLQMIHQAGSLSAPLPKETELYNKLQARIPGLSEKDRSDLLPAMRSVKEPRELELMEKAIAATLNAQRAAARNIWPGAQENWVEGLIALEFKRGGAVRPAFSSIVGSGPNSTILHYPKHDQRIAAGSLVVCDIGADYGHYAADVTRTYPADGHFTPEQRRVYDIVLRAQQECIDMIKPGVFYEDIHEHAASVIRAAGYGDYFIHGLGHFVGLDVHDAGLYSKPLQPGMVITVEPGIYLPAKSLGVRIEDMVLVTPTGHRLMTEALPRKAEEIEGMMRAGR